MSDIIDRLHSDDKETHMLMRDAALEIEYLREAIASLDKSCEKLRVQRDDYYSKWMDERAAK